MIFTGLDGSKRVPVFPLITTTNPLQIKLLRLILFLTHTKIHTNYRRNLIPYNGRYHRNSTPRTKVSCNVRRENKVSRYFSNDNRRADFIYRLCPPHRIFRLMPIYPVCSAFIIRQCCHGTFSRSILGHLLLSGMFSPCHFCRVWT